MKVFRFLLISFLFFGCVFALVSWLPRNNDCSHIARAYPVVWTDVGMFENELHKK